MTDFFAKIAAQYTNELPFVVYRKPNDTLVTTVFQKDSNVHYVNDYSESGFVFAPFDAVNKTVIIPFEECFTTDFNQGNNIDFSDVALNFSDVEKHKKLVTKGISEIHNTSLEKVVLSRVEEVTVQQISPILLFQKALMEYSNAFVYLWFHPEIGCWLGATPEVLLTTRNNHFKTMALAGTQVFSDALTWEDKEQEEQQIVTDYIAHNLSSEQLDFQVGEPYTVKAGHLAHIRTDISGSFKSNNLQQLLSVLHPTPAVCGMPKQEAKEFIMANEEYNRTFYTGFLGELNKSTQRKNNRRNTENNAYRFISKTSELYVNLRCMELQKNSTKIYVGGGITASSDPEKEFIETCNKTKTMKKLIIS